MNKEQEYASDTDESDEDFCPNEAGESAVSEEESDGCIKDLVEEEQHDGGGDANKQKLKNVKKGKKLTKKKKKDVKGKSKDVESDEAVEDAERNKREKTEEIKRTTRRNEGSLSNGKGKTLEKDVIESDEEDKSRTNALWADFLKDVGPSTKKPSKPPKDDIAPTNVSSSSNGISQDYANKSQSNGEETKKKITVTEVLDFAGEEIRIQKEIDASSVKENKAAATSAPKMQPFGRIMPGAGIKRPATSAGGGLGSILNKIGKKQKISVLDKSQMDWKSFKQEEGIDETLQTYNKGKDGYLERQDFLQRTDLRQFEIEKNLRQSTRRPH